MTIFEIIIYNVSKSFEISKWIVNWTLPINIVWVPYAFKYGICIKFNEEWKNVYDCVTYINVLYK